MHFWFLDCQDDWQVIFQVGTQTRGKLMRYHWRYLLAALFFIASTCIHGEVATAQDDSTKKVLILNSYHPGYAWSDVEQAGIVDTFRAQDSNWVPFIEYLDCKRRPRGENT